MKFTLPIVVEAHPLKETRETEYRVRPVFVPHVEGRSRQLTRAMSRLTSELRKVLREVAKERRHERLAELVYSPDLSSSRLTLTIGLRRRSITVKLLVVTLESLDRTLAFATPLPELWFEIPRGSSLTSRAEEVLTEHFRKRELQDGDEFVSPEQFSLASNAWVTTLDLDLHVPDVRKEPLKELFASFGGGEVLDGADELDSVGHCLDRAYPDDLDRVVLRDREVAELSRWLWAADARPILLLGPRQVGKTGIVHEAVYRKVDEHKDSYRNHQNVWALSPQRLISGMSYVGQWENRLIAILKETAKREHVLYFDDVLGLYVAGQCSSSSLSVANVLKPYVDRGEVRLLAEMTPEAFRVLRERDRGFADLFHIIPVNETPPADTLRILMQTQRQLEERHDCSFEIDALPQVIDVTRRYARSEAFPGKAVWLMKRLAITNNSASRSASASGQSSGARNVRGLTPSGSPKAECDSEFVIDRRAVLGTFHEQSGLPLAFLDLDQKLAVSDIVDGLRRRFVGQDAAVAVAAEIIGTAKARLNDPDRPLASLLLLGPTGVGKTQFAKALAAYLFGSDERLLRFDMNEYVSATSVPQLIGTFRNPEGLLTSAVRRNPFAVVLFDEIEKAHPDVFDLLLQVLGEGRLTDALGRTTDFTNTLILLTSNLGAQRSDTGLGFGSRDEHAKSASVKAAENFFRPEFFNRLDRVLPFDRLSRDEMRRIAALMVDDLFHRGGLARRNVVPVVSPEAIEWIVLQGYEPVLGARALRRALDRELVRPIAARLAAQAPGGLTVIQVNQSGDGLSVTTQELEVAQPIPNSVATLVCPVRACRSDVPVSSVSSVGATNRTDGTNEKSREPFEKIVDPTDCFFAEDVLEIFPRAKACLGRLRQNIDLLRPSVALSSGQLSPEHERYFLLRERWQSLDEEWRVLSQDAERHAAQERNAAPSGPATHRAAFRGSGGSDSARSIARHGRFAREFDADDEIDDFLSEQAAIPELMDVELRQRTGQLVADLAWLNEISNPEHSLTEFDQRGLLILTFGNVDHGHGFLEYDSSWLFDPGDFDASVRWLDPRHDPAARRTPLPPELCGELTFAVEGPRVSRLFESLAGTIVFHARSMRLIRIDWQPLSPGEEASLIWQARQSRESGQQKNSTTAFRPIVITHEGRDTTDIRSGLTFSQGNLSRIFPLSLIASLPLPMEFVDAK